MMLMMIMLLIINVHHHSEGVFYEDDEVHQSYILNVEIPKLFRDCGENARGEKKIRKYEKKIFSRMLLKKSTTTLFSYYYQKS